MPSQRCEGRADEDHHGNGTCLPVMNVMAPRPDEKVSMERLSAAIELPRDVWLAIAIKVAVNSIEDLCMFRMTCCAARDAGEEDAVLRMVSIPPQHDMKWWWTRDPTSKRFFERCFEAGHPELLFREALRELYIQRNDTIGWEMLQNTTSNGLDTAKYALPMELLIRRDDDDDKKNGLELFRALEADDLLPVCYSSCFAILTIAWPEEVQMPKKGDDHMVCDSARCLTQGHMGLLYDYCRKAAARGSIHVVGGANHIPCIRCRADYEVERYLDIHKF
ncbi:uncharacterized protein LOC130945531 [Arachis stenosperma]|uniref:uncharacterized protein LOC130945531 n=1 Tax=Arachis stenosperma TaxID=217475 RepID=UPI0025AC36D3|nr:uncharacterized protein LOC130945531 [Arachis stenosperma]